MTNRLDNVIQRNKRLRFADLLFILAIGLGIGGAVTAVNSQAQKQVSTPTLILEAPARIVDASECQPSEAMSALRC